MKDSLTRLFFVVESRESNPELFETEEDARSNAQDWKSQGDSRVIIEIRKVKNAYQDNFTDGHSGWNYEDLSDTFQTIKKLSFLN